MTDEVAAEQRKVADHVEDFVARRLVGEAQVVVDGPRGPKTSRSAIVVRVPNPWRRSWSTSCSSINVLQDASSTAKAAGVIAWVWA